MENREKQIAEVLFGLINNSLQKLDDVKNNGSTFEEDISKVLENSFNYMESEGWIGEWEKL
jgi:hypothetical protein